MKLLLKIVAGLIVIGVVTFFLGPRPDATDTITFKPDDIGNDLDAYLAASEEDIANLIDGAEKEIVWNNAETKERTEYSVVYIHGFSATKHETRPVPDNVAKALGANLYFTRLSGHGRDSKAMAEATVQKWANDFAETIEIGKRLGDKVILMGTSTGVTISTWGLAKDEFSKQVAAAVFVSGNYELQGISTNMGNIPWAEKIMPAMAGDTYSWEGKNELHNKWWTTSYPTVAFLPMMALLKRVKAIDKSILSTPAMFIYSPEDTVIVPAEIEKVASQWGGPTKTHEVTEVNDPSKHVITGDITAPENTAPVSQAIITWLNATLN
jgi:esterase/lipase